MEPEDPDYVGVQAAVNDLEAALVLVQEPEMFATASKSAQANNRRAVLLAFLLVAASIELAGFLNLNSRQQAGAPKNARLSDMLPIRLDLAPQGPVPVPPPAITLAPRPIITLTLDPTKTPVLAQTLAPLMNSGNLLTAPIELQQPKIESPAEATALAPAPRSNLGPNEKGISGSVQSDVPGKTNDKGGGNGTGGGKH
jgi:hypothetical protein